MPGPWMIPEKHSDPENDSVTADMGLTQNYKATYALLVSYFDFLCETD